MIHIAYTINSGYVKYCGVAMLSAARSAPGQRFSFHVIANDLTQADREFLSKLGAKENAKVSFYAVPDELASRYKVTWDANRLPLLVYYRCFLASLLPKDVEKVIYMDCDTLVLHSLQELWETPLEGKAIAACRDEVQFKPERAERLMYDASYGYFNGGVLLINLKYWREHHVEEALREFYQKYPERIVYNDQDLLNAVLYDKKVMVSLRWNVQGMFYKRKGRTPGCRTPSLRGTLYQSPQALAPLLRPPLQGRMPPIPAGSSARMYGGHGKTYGSLASNAPPAALSPAPEALEVYVQGGNAGVGSPKGHGVNNPEMYLSAWIEPRPARLAYPVKKVSTTAPRFQYYFFPISVVLTFNPNYRKTATICAPNYRGVAMITCVHKLRFGKSHVLFPQIAIR